jgi:NADPH:quinone reductase-like Zn-dependent oxidoreductase
MIDIITAIVALDSATQVSVHGDEVIWHDGNPNGITAEQITAKQTELQDAYDNDYARKRLEEYPSVDSLVVALWEGVVEERMAAVTQLEIKRQAVKAKYPK